MECYNCKAKSVCAAVVQPGSVLCLMNRMRYCGTHLEAAPTTAASGKRGDGMSGRTTERILNAAAKGLLFLFLYVMLGLCWIGAECVFEGIVHDSRVDGVVLAWLCWLIVREIEQFERKIRGDRR